MFVRHEGYSWYSLVSNTEHEHRLHEKGGDLQFEMIDCNVKVSLTSLPPLTVGGTWFASIKKYMFIITRLSYFRSFSSFLDFVFHLIYPSFLVRM